MDLGELQVFLTVAKEGSFSRAAERLYRTQPAISLGIRKLEDSLGQPLFVRGSRPVRLTDAGVMLKEYAERLLNLRDEVKKGLTELEGLKRGELSLGVNESSIHALLPALSKFREMHPGILIRVHRMFSRDIPHEVLNYRLDVGAISFVPREPQLQATEILKDELTLVVPLKKLSARGRSFLVHSAAPFNPQPAENMEFAVQDDTGASQRHWLVSCLRRPARLPAETPRSTRDGPTPPLRPHCRGGHLRLARFLRGSRPHRGSSRTFRLRQRHAAQRALVR